MLLSNDTNIAAMAFGDLHRDGMEMVVFCARASYLLTPEGNLALADRQEIALNDIYECDPLRTPLVGVGDLIPFKPQADITLIGTAHAPNGDPSSSWKVACAVAEHRIGLRVYGPRKWEPTLHFLKPTWKLGPAQKVTSVPLDYRHATGGYVAGHPNGEADLRNPIGPGLLHREWTPPGHGLNAPQIEALDDPITHPFTEPQPKGLGPVPPFSAWRERYCGTRDETWQRDRCPQMPADFDYRFFQTAHPDLVVPLMRGDEAVRLEGLVYGGAELTFTLPGIVPIARHKWSDGRKVSMRLTLDGLHMDLRAPKAPWRVDLTWRGWVVQCPAYLGASLTLVSIDEAAGFLVSSEYGLTEQDALS